MGGVERIAGIDRYQTAAMVAERFATKGAANDAIVASGTAFPDALAAAAIAGTVPNPFYLVSGDAIPPDVARALEAQRPDRIFVVGGPSVVSESVRVGLGAFVSGGGEVNVQRLAGPDRYATSAAVARHAWGGAQVGNVLIASGEGFPDALAAAAAAARETSLLLLVQRDRIPASVAALLREIRPQGVVVVGGPAVVSDAVVASLARYTASGTSVASRLAGPDRYATAVRVSRQFNLPGSSNLVLASGADFPDALAGAAVGQSMLLVPPVGVPTNVSNEIDRLRTPSVWVLGGTRVISEATVASVRAVGGDTETTVALAPEPGEPITDGTPRLFHAGNSHFDVIRWGSGFQVHIDGPDVDRFVMTFITPPGEPLRPGRHPVRRAGQERTGELGFSIHGNSAACNEVGGFVDVKAVTTDDLGNMMQLWATFSHECELFYRLPGEIKLGWPRPATDAPYPSALHFPPRYPNQGGGALAVSLLAWSDDVVVSAVAIGGLQPGAFRIDADGCTDATLTLGTACQVRISHRPTAPGPQLATLTITDNNGRRHISELLSSAFAGRTTFRFDSDPGDPIGQGRSVSYNTSTASVWGVSTDDSFAVHAGSLQDRWTAEFAAPDDEMFQVGKTYVAGRYMPGSPEAGLSITGNFRGCNRSMGWFTVSHARYAADGAIQEFAATFEQHCEGVEAGLRGAVEYRIPEGDTVPPRAVANLKATVTGPNISLSWASPTDSDFAGVIVRRLPGIAPPKTFDSGTLVFAGAGTSVQSPRGTGSAAFLIQTFDRSGNLGPGATLVVP